jgi:hypothetical protein
MLSPEFGRDRQRRGQHIEFERFHLLDVITVCGPTLRRRPHTLCGNGLLDVIGNLGQMARKSAEELALGRVVREIPDRGGFRRGLAKTKDQRLPVVHGDTSVRNVSSGSSFRRRDTAADIRLTVRLRHAFLYRPAAKASDVAGELTSRFRRDMLFKF